MIIKGLITKSLIEEHLEFLCYCDLMPFTKNFADAINYCPVSHVNALLSDWEWGVFVG